MFASLKRIACVLVGVSLMIDRTALGQETDPAVFWPPQLIEAFKGQVPLPTRIVQSELVVFGRVTGMESDDVKATLSPSQRRVFDYRKAVVKVHEVILGQKDLKELQLGFVAKTQGNAKILDSGPTRIDPDLRTFETGQDGLFFLRTHHENRFFVSAVLFGGGFVSSDSPDFAKKLTLARRLGQALERPLEALKAENASNRFLAAEMLTHRYRIYTAYTSSKWTEKAIDAEESKRLLKSLIEADWQDAKEATAITMYPPHPYQVFLRLGVTKADGYEPPISSEIRDTLRYTQDWLQTNQQKYCIRQFVPLADRLENEEAALKAELENLEGAWRMVNLEIAGKPVAIGGHEYLYFAGTKITRKSGFRVTDFQFTINPSKTPKWIDATYRSGAQGKGIYELKANTLRLFIEANGERPTEFKTASGTQQAIQIYERVKLDEQGGVDKK